MNKPWFQFKVHHGEWVIWYIVVVGWHHGLPVGGVFVPVGPYRIDLGFAECDLVRVVEFFLRRWMIMMSEVMVVNQFCLTIEYPPKYLLLVELKIRGFGILAASYEVWLVSVTSLLFSLFSSVAQLSYLYEKTFA